LICVHVFVVVAAISCVLFVYLINWSCWVYTLLFWLEWREMLLLPPLLLLLLLPLAPKSTL
jgi:hypothetical protein